MARTFKLVLWGAAVLLAAGCSKAQPKQKPEPAHFQAMHIPLRKIVRTVSQPSFIESYERTSIYPKVTGFIEKWNVDIGDRVKKDEVLATLYVPELVEDFGTKKATVQLDLERIDLALELVKVSDADVQAADASLTEAKAILAQYEAQVDRWDSEVARLTREVKKGVVDPQVLLESTNQLKSSRASRDSAEATIKKAEAELLSKKASLSKSKVDVDVARADLAVAQSEARRLDAWVGYLKLESPYDGIIVARNANTRDFVTPAVGDPTAMQQSPYLAPGSKAAPIYVVDRIDIVRIFVDIPEQDANYVAVGTKATVLARAYRDELISASVTRTSWALNVKSRTLRAEIDLPNTNSQILPGMYAYANVVIERPHVRAVPNDALDYSGDQVFVWLYKDGHAVRTEIEIGASDGEWTEVTNRRVQSSKKSQPDESHWTPIDGTEQVLLGDLTTLSEGSPVRIESKEDSEKHSPGSTDSKPATGDNGDR